MKKYVTMILSLLLALLVVLPVAAQDGDLTIEPVAVATEAATVEAVATTEAGGDVVINVDAPEAPAPAPNPAPVQDNTFERLGLLALLLLLIVDKISGHYMSMRLATMVPLEWRQTAGNVVENAQRTGLQTAYQRVKQTPEPWDDTMLTEGAKIIGWEFITNTDGSVTARRIPVPVNPVTPGG